MKIQFTDHYNELMKITMKEVPKICAIQLHALDRAVSLVEKGELDQINLVEKIHTNTELSKMSLKQVLEETNAQNARAQADGISRLMSLRSPKLDLRKSKT